MFSEILLFKQHYGVNNVAQITIMINTIIIIIIVVLQAIQHDLMQQCYQYLVLIHIQNAQQEIILQNNFIFHVFDDFATVFNAICHNIKNDNEYVHMLLKYGSTVCEWCII